MWKNDFCGIYKIENLVNHKMYIGQSHKIKRRWSDHKKVLRKGKNKNRLLQEDWNTYGENNFIFDIIELCPSEELDKKEKYYIKKYNTFNSDDGYNLNSGGISFDDVSDSTKALLTISGTGSNNPNSRAVICLETKQTYESTSLAGKAYRIDGSNIYRCCTLQRYTTLGLHWMYLEEYENSSDEYIQELMTKTDRGRKRPVIYLNTLEVFESMDEASVKTGVNANSISQCCSHGRPRAGRTPDGEPRIFMYYKEYLENQKDRVGLIFLKGE